jgi:PhnB protein
MTQINAYIHFDGQCQEAMEFYRDCLGGELTLQKVGETSMAAQSPEAIHQQIIHASLTRGSLLLMGSDLAAPGFVKGNNISLSLTCSSEEEINSFFSKLSAGGKVEHPVNISFWGALFGSFKDKFGIDWMLTYNKNEQ